MKLKTLDWIKQFFSFFYLYSVTINLFSSWVKLSLKPHSHNAHLHRLTDWSSISLIFSYWYSLWNWCENLYYMRYITPENCPSLAKWLRRLELAGHCVRHSEEVASNLVLWKPSHGKLNRGRKRKTYLDSLMNDTNMERLYELQSLMMDRDLWRHLVNNCCSSLGWCPA